MGGLRSAAPRGCLMNMVDDATSTTCCRMGEQETIWAAVGVLRSWIEKYGVPRALYTMGRTYIAAAHCWGAPAGKGGHDAVWADVRAIRDGDNCG